MVGSLLRVQLSSERNRRFDSGRQEAGRGINELLIPPAAETATHPEDTAMTEEKKEPEQDTPAHATEEERERLKDFNKDGIPPGAC